MDVQGYHLRCTCMKLCISDPTIKGLDYGSVNCIEHKITIFFP